MTAVVVDASVVVTLLLHPGPDGDRARAAVDGHDLSAPELIDVEVTSAVRRLAAARLVSTSSARRALDLLAAAPLTRYPHLPLVSRAWDLRDNLTAYDAVYAALAELLGATLLTADHGLATAAGPHCPRQYLD